MLKKVTSYVGRLLNISKPASSAVAAHTIPIGSNHNPEVESTITHTIIQPKYTLRKDTRRSILATKQAILKPSNNKTMASLKTTGDNIIWMDLEVLYPIICK